MCPMLLHAARLFVGVVFLHCSKRHSCDAIHPRGRPSGVHGGHGRRPCGALSGAVRIEAAPFATGSGTAGTA